jgi:Plasmid pRiA4b ORF-3-like protein
VLSEPGDRFTYTYDFGDDWEHDIKLEKVLPPDPRAVVPACLAGKGACPPEDCGGASGYADLKEAIIDPARDEHAELLDWLGIDDPSDFTPAAFDLDRANARLRRAPLS